MNRFTTLAHAAVIAATLFGATAAFADPFTSALVASDPLQKGRLSRNGVPQDYSGTEPYPGIINPTLNYHFHAYQFQVNSVDNFITLTIDSLSANTFVAAYANAYYVTNPQTSFLGDPGTSGNAFQSATSTGDPLSFSFVGAINSTIVLIINETTPNAGLGAPFTLYAQGFSDAGFGDFPGTDYVITSGGRVIPEPSTLLLLAPLALVIGLKSRRRKTKDADLPLAA